jgi:hypothetical protein
LSSSRACTRRPVRAEGTVPDTDLETQREVIDAFSRRRELARGVLAAGRARVVADGRDVSTPARG